MLESFLLDRNFILKIVFASKESRKSKQARARGIVDLLSKTYPNAHCALDHCNPLELLIATILSAQCSDVQVNLVTKRLFQKYTSARDFAKVPLPELEKDIRRIGLFRNKARHIQSCCRQLLERHKGEVPQSMDALILLAGVGRKTANVVLGNAFGICAGIVVDTHVARLSRRFHLSSEKTPEKIERDLQLLIDPSLWIQFSHWLIWHGRKRCSARNPDCKNCEIKTLCPSADQHDEHFHQSDL